MATIHPYPYATYLSAATEASSSHITTKCMMRSCTTHDEPSPLPVYAENMSPIRAEEDQRRRHVKREEAWIKDSTSSSEAYGKSRVPTNFEVIFIDAGANTYKYEPQDDLLDRWEK